ncbi:F-box protein [Corynebacterium sp.]
MPRRRPRSHPRCSMVCRSLRSLLDKPHSTHLWLNFRLARDRAAGRR